MVGELPGEPLRRDRRLGLALEPDGAPAHHTAWRVRLWSCCFGRHRVCCWRQAGLAIWQFADMREEDAGGGLGPLVPDRNKPACRNNKGVLDAYHRPKLAFYSVRQVWRPEALLEW